MARIVIPSRRNPTWSDARKVARSRGKNSLAPELWDSLVGLYTGKQYGGGMWFDLSGHHNDGTLTNMTPATDWVVGPEGPGLDFDGTDDTVIANATMLGASFSKLTVHVVAKMDVISKQVAVGKTSETSKTDIVCGCWDANGVARLYIGTANARWISSNGFWVQDEWIHATFVYDGSLANGSKGQGYKNGEPFSTSSDNIAATSVTASSSTLAIGDNAFFGTVGWSSWNGQIESVMIWKQRCLEPSLIQQLYANPDAHLTPRPLQVPVGAAVSAANWYYYAQEQAVA